MIMSLRAALVLATTLAVSASPPARAAVVVPPGDAAIWDLRPLYPNADAWDTAAQALAGDAKALAKLGGTLSSAGGLADAMARISTVERQLQRLSTYASLKADEDTRIAANQARVARAQDLAASLDQATAFLRPEVIGLGAAKIDGFIATEPRLHDFTYRLHSILRDAPHTLGAEAEHVMAAAALPLAQPQSVYDMLSNADMPWPTLRLHGANVRLDPEAYVTHRGDADPATRLAVFTAFFGTLKNFERSFGAIYAAELRNTAFVAQARHYPSGLDMSLAADNMPRAVYDTLIRETDAGLPVLHRYLRARQKLLHLKVLRYSDINVSLAASPKTYSLADARAEVLAATAPLGSDYTTAMAAALTGDWLHAKVQPGKHAGAYMNGDAYDVHPYVLLSYTGDYYSLSTVAHEFGHAMHSVLANIAQPFPTAAYATFIAEIPSTANEMLLDDKHIAAARTKAERIFAINQELELLRITYFRQAMLAEFEARAHAAAEHGDVITGDAISAIFRDVLRRYYGADTGVTEIDPLFGVEWAYIPHFYNDFYVYQYATSISAAAYFAGRIEAGDMAARDRFLNLLRAGGSDDPYVLVRRAGLDMASPAPYRALIARMNGLLDKLDVALAEKN